MNSFDVETNILNIVDKIRNEHMTHVNFKSFEGLDWLACGFSTRFGGVSKGCCSTMNLSFARGDDPEDVKENIRIFSKEIGFKPENIVMPHQCHTDNVQTVGKKECGRGVVKPGTEEEIDGQITNEKEVVLFCFGADCVPVFIVDTEKRVVGAVHAGWRGTINDIPGVAVSKMKREFGSNPKNIKAVIGPSICQDCYEVSDDVAEAFINRYGEKKINDNKIIYDKNPSGKYFLNLWEANRTNLIASGIAPDNIEICGICTKCYPDIFFSHRKHGNDRGVNAGYIFITK